MYMCMNVYFVVLLCKWLVSVPMPLLSWAFNEGATSDGVSIVSNGGLYYWNSKSDGHNGVLTLMDGAYVDVGSVYVGGPFSVRIVALPTAINWYARFINFASTINDESNGIVIARAGDNSNIWI